MAVFRIDYYSASLHRNANFAAIIPMDRAASETESYPDTAPFKTLYLLHGMMGSSADWLYNSNIVSFAAEKNIAVILPDGGNRYYIDNTRTGEMFGKLVGKELVEVTRKMFHLSDKREDTYIGGFSMGGYGAMRNGLKYHDTFGGIINLSGGFRYKLLNHLSDGSDGFVFGNTKSFFEAVYGDFDQIKGSDIDLEALVARLKEEKAEFPRIYMAYGTEDNHMNFGLGTLGKEFAAYLRNHDVPVTYEEGPGGHEFQFWNTYIQRALNWWLPDADCGKQN